MCVYTRYIFKNVVYEQGCAEIAQEWRIYRITSYNVCYTKLLRIECFLGIRRGTKKMMIRMLSIVVLMFISLGIISLITEPFLGKLITKFFESAGSSGSYKEMVEAVLGNAGLSNDGSEILSGFTVGMTIALCKPVVFIFVSYNFV